MATVRFSINPEDPIESVVISAGAAVAVKAIELTVDQSTTTITDAGSPTGTRAIKRGEVVIALQNLIAALQRDNTTLAI
jgi:hypothetical protein